MTKEVDNTDDNVLEINATKESEGKLKQGSEAQKVVEIKTLGNLKVGDYINGLKIKSIIAQSNEAVVCVTETGSVQYQWNNLSYDHSEVTNKFHMLEARINRNVTRQVWSTLVRELGAAFYSAMVSDTLENALAKFDEVEIRIMNVKTQQEVKALIISYAFLVSSIISGVLIFFSNINFLSQSVIYLCMSAGVGGAFFSLLSRNEKLGLDLFASKAFLILQSSIICLTGVMSGLIMYVFSMSNIAFGFAANDLYTLLTVSLAAGFSERLIPDLFGKIESGKN